VTHAVLRLPADHPSAEGHFPDNPVVPAAVLLDEILAIIERAYGGSQLPWAVKSAKFLHPVRPGHQLAIEFTGAPAGGIRFRCRLGELEVVSGLVQSEAG
jgi:3-hydroxyacyl-[acyl-carrier-protein] dehydratase